jgi:hypothetical protein
VYPQPALARDRCRAQRSEGGQGDAYPDPVGSTDALEYCYIERTRGPGSHEQRDRVAGRGVHAVNVVAVASGRTGF